MTIYQELLGEGFYRLHPKLQERYTLPIGESFLGEGTMTQIESGPALLMPLFKLATRWKFLFPESGADIPFTIKNSCRALPTGEAEIYWERSFYFDKVTRHFNAFMTIDEERKVVKDYLGEPSLFYSDLAFTVTAGGGMTIGSGMQRMLIGKWEIPIPRLLEGVVTVEEGYDEGREVFTIRVDIRNRIVGRLMTYEGEFKETSV
ncbi:DUF4166 domain-containing protein [Bacillus sp. PS06]|uniref:DUF4166 domain-containing protein n=1 Tax=Bacillus sp. PS06 TaxID=2764176 RepID=UPI001781FA44|nr:DUF4166 domain-containing protein [Bacillus sp. PS06]MBD8071460.1 DUF4166 domain-containing protein [Bacillus sp. PS06]